MQCTDRGLIETRIQLKKDHEKLPNDVPLFDVIYSCRIKLSVRQDSQLPTESDKKTLPIVEIV
jgi:hypothetical protein